MRTSRIRQSISLFIAATGLLASCRAPAPATPPSTALVIDPSRRLELASDDDLASTLERSAFAYFRFVNGPFARKVCQRFEEYLPSMPEVNLHGDAHIEQYAVTSDGVGLSDYDHASAGPGVIDLVRFGASAELTCRLRGWSCRDARVIDAFLGGYKDALRDPSIARTEPAVVARMRTRFAPDRMTFLQSVSRMMAPIGLPKRTALLEGMKGYVDVMLEEHEGLTASFFEIVQAGTVEAGVGSRLDEKFLVRIQGPSDSPDDDVILEVKTPRPPVAPCMRSGAAFSILVGKSRIEGSKDPLMAVLPGVASATPSWVHTWAENFQELDVGRTLASPVELAEVARDVGIQLGLGHVLGIADPFGSQLRRAQLQLTNELEPSLRKAMIELAQDSWDGWQEYRRERREAHTKAE